MSIGNITSSYPTLGSHNLTANLQLHPRAAATTFASDILQRVGDPANLTRVPAVKPVASRPATETEDFDAANSGNTAQSAAVAKALQEKTEQGKKLESALADTVSYMADKFGDTAASTMMGLVYKRVGDGPVTEDSLGQGILDAVKFIDKNFGTQKGDELIAKVNGELNENLNAFFDNGSNETFFATTTPLPEGSLSIQANVPQATVQEESGPAEAITTLLSDYKTQRDNAKIKKNKKLPGFAGTPYGDATNFTPPSGIILDAVA